MKRNLTIALDEDVVAKARVVAARRGTSLSGLVSQEITRLALRDEGYEAAKAEALRRLSKGARLGGKKVPSRDSLHER